MVQVDWKFELAHSYGTSEMIRIGELSHARGRTLSPLHNRPGSLAFNYPLDGELANDITKIETAIIAVKNGVPVWSGPVWQTKESTNDNKIQVTAVGWTKLLDKRLLRVDKTYADPLGTDDGAIAFELLAQANDASGSLGLARPSKVIDGVTVNARSVSWIKPGTYHAGPDSTPYTAVRRRQSYLAWQTYIGPSIQQLSDIEDGFDYWVDPTYVTLEIARKRMIDRQNVLFGYNAGPENLVSAERDGDADKTMNFMRVVSPAGNVLVPATESINRIGYFEETANLADVQLGGTNPADKLNIAAAYGAEETILRMWPQELYVIQPQALSGESDESMPSIFEDFGIGDLCGLVVDKGRFSTSKEQRFRLFGATINIDEENNEKISNMQIYWDGGGG